MDNTNFAAGETAVVDPSLNGVLCDFDFRDFGDEIELANRPSLVSCEAVTIAGCGSE